jgi:hypothetical protein
MSVILYNPSTSYSGMINILPTFQLFQNWNGGIILAATTGVVKFWFGGDASSSIQSPTNQFFLYDFDFNFQIKKIFLYHSPIFNVNETVSFRLEDVGTSLTNIGTLTGIVGTQMSEIDCTPYVINAGQKIQMNVLNNQYANIFKLYQLTILCEKV